MYEVGEIIKLIKKIRKLDYYILIPVILLSAIGIVMVYSSSSYLAAEMNNLQYHFRRQIVYVVVGFFLLFITYLMNHQIIKNRKFIRAAYLVTIALLLLVLVFGDEINGARAWLNLGFFQIQPAEIAKISIIMLFAGYYARNMEKSANDFVKTLIKPGIALLLVLGLIFWQPDVGSVSIILLTAFVMILASGVSWKKSVF
ncbi:MAG: FtsW/RodA/SpoVE family cell cycle protein, partial [Clostridia bacterium]|nr:FtsW/RodA/SpoVE family cell cycle protein [Clostridia bacterium]